MSINEQCSIATIQVHSHFLPPAQALLYSTPFARNAGRAFLLERTLSGPAGASLSALILSFSALANKSEDSGRPNSITSILERTESITTLALGAMLFVHSDASEKLREVIKAKRHVRKFSFGFANATPFDSPKIGDLLAAWPDLNDLSLDTIILHHSIPRTVDCVTPMYELRKLSLFRVAIKGRRALEFMLGGSTSSLRDLSLHEVTLEDDEEEGNRPSDLLLGSASLERLERLSLRDVDWESSLSRQPFKPCRLDDLPLSQCTSLKELCLGDHHAADLSLIFDRLHLPPQLRRLELYGRQLYRQVRLEDALLDLTEAPELEDVVIFGPSRTAIDVQRIGRIARNRGVTFYVKFLH